MFPLMMVKKKRGIVALLLLIICLGFSGCMIVPATTGTYIGESDTDFETYQIINDNIPYFTEEEITTEPFETYSELDALGRCSVAYANICKELMPTEERGDIGMIKPSGWQVAKYDCVDGKYLYNRCHLIAFMLAGENANEKNLITGTRYMNTEGMLPFETKVSDYVKSTGNHVLYRVTPVFEGYNLIADGVEMEALSVEDHGKGICFHVFVNNVQPGIEINYATGESRLAPEKEGEIAQSKENKKQSYVLNTKSKKIHKPNCSSVKDIQKENKKKVTENRETLIQQGYEPCKRCNP